MKAGYNEEQIIISDEFWLLVEKKLKYLLVLNAQCTQIYSRAMKFLSAQKSKVLKGVVRLLAMWIECIIDITCVNPYCGLNISLPP
jgi:hypothetical protein